MSELSIILPIRAESFAFYRRRLELRDGLDLTSVETIVVDDGSVSEAAGEIRQFCLERGYKYLRLESGDREFSLARSRNAGLRAVSSPLVYMEDADLIYCRDFFQQVISQLQVLDQTPFNFVSVPAVYLTQAATERVFSVGGLDTLYRHVLNSLLLEDPKGSPNNKTVDSYSPASGVVALRRDLALKVGGYDESFSGWGGEDRDFIFRLLCANRSVRLPANFVETKSWNLNDTLVYEGWRALHRLHGDFMARQGLYAVHLHHEKLPWRTAFSSVRNMRLAAQKAARNEVVPTSAGSVFELTHTVLFDVFRLHHMLGDGKLAADFGERLNIVNRARAVRGIRSRRPMGSKLRKLFTSPLQFFEDSRYSVLRMLARLLRKS